MGIRLNPIRSRVGFHFRFLLADLRFRHAIKMHRWLDSGENAAQVVVLATILDRLQGDLIERITSAVGANELE